jgi:hypothetical protein
LPAGEQLTKRVHSMSEPLRGTRAITKHGRAGQRLRGRECGIALERGR